MVAFDATVLSVLLNPHSRVGIPGSDKAVDRPRERLDELLKQLDAAGERVAIPTPALAEVLVLAGDNAPEHVSQVTKAARFHICDFDIRCAIELAEWNRGAAASKKGKRLGIREAYQKVKIDLQILAIAKVNGASTIYTDDPELAKLARTRGMAATGIADLPTPPATQLDLNLPNS